MRVLSNFKRVEVYQELNIDKGKLDLTSSNWLSLMNIQFLNEFSPTRALSRNLSLSSL